MNGNVAEGPGANFFYEKEGELYTCPTGNILPGITRKTVFELAEELKISIHEKWFKVEDVYAADTAFFCGTAAEVAGINSLDDNEFPMNWDDSVSALIQRKYKLRVSTNEHKEMLI
jgi:branched-chain amino acid aminotransferase